MLISQDTNVWVYLDTSVIVPDKMLKKAIYCGGNLLSKFIPTKDGNMPIELITRELYEERCDTVWVLKGGTTIVKHLVSNSTILAYNIGMQAIEKVIFHNNEELFCERISQKTLYLRKNTVWVQKGTDIEINCEQVLIQKYDKFDGHSNPFAMLVQNMQGNIIELERMTKSDLALRKTLIWVREGTDFPIPIEWLSSLQYLDGGYTKAQLDLKGQLPIFASLVPKNLLNIKNAWIYKTTELELEPKWHFHSNFFPTEKKLFDGKKFIELRRESEPRPKRRASTWAETLETVPLSKKYCLFAIPLNEAADDLPAPLRQTI